MQLAAEKRDLETKDKNAPPGTGDVARSPPLQKRPTNLIKRDSSVADKFASSDDLNQFVENAYKNPDRASFFYALQALRECDELINLLYTAEVPAGTEDNPRRTEAVTRAKYRCRNLPPDNTSGAQRRRLGTDGVQAGDVGFAAVAPQTIQDSIEYDAKLEKTRMQQKIDSIFISNDAGVVGLALQDLMSASDALIINGRSFTEIERSSLPAALLLLGCDLGQPCDTSNFFLRRECLGLGRCDFVDVEDFAKRADPLTWQMFTKGSRYDYLTAKKIKEEIEESIKIGASSAVSLKSLPP